MATNDESESEIPKVEFAISSQTSQPKEPEKQPEDSDEPGVLNPSEEVAPETTSDSDEPEKASKETQKNTDPIRWFGILVPPALRSAQADFITAVEGPIPQLTNIARDLRNQEIEIGRIRKQIKKL